MVQSVVSWNVELGGRVYAGAFGVNLASVVLNIFSHLMTCLKKL